LSSTHAYFGLFLIFFFFSHCFSPWTLFLFLISVFFFHSARSLLSFFSSFFYSSPFLASPLCSILLFFLSSPVCFFFHFSFFFLFLHFFWFLFAAAKREKHGAGMGAATRLVEANHGDARLGSQATFDGQLSLLAISYLSFSVGCSLV
jgi:hypothetical protein